MAHKMLCAGFADHRKGCDSVEHTAKFAVADHSSQSQNSCDPNVRDGNSGFHYEGLMNHLWGRSRVIENSYHPALGWIVFLMKFSDKFGEGALVALSSYLPPVALSLLWHCLSCGIPQQAQVPQETQCHKRDIFKIVDYQILKMIIFLR